MVDGPGCAQWWDWTCQFLGGGSRTYGECDSSALSQSAFRSGSGALGSIASFSLDSPPTAESQYVYGGYCE